MTHLFVLHTILEYVLDNQTACLTQGNFMPYPVQGLVDFRHDLWRLTAPPELEQLLPNMTCIAVDHCLWDSAEKLIDHDSFMLFGNTVKGLLNNMTSKGVHAQVEGVASYRISDCDNLVGSTMLKTPLNEEVAESIYHERIGLADNGLDDVVLLLSRPNLELLLEKDGRLLVVVANDFVHNVFPVARDILV